MLKISIQFWKIIILLYLLNKYLRSILMIFLSYFHLLALHVTNLRVPHSQAEEEVRELQKKMQQLENDLDQTQEKLMNANQRLEEKEKALQNVSRQYCSASLTGQGGSGGPREENGAARERASHHYY